MPTPITHAGKAGGIFALTGCNALQLLAYFLLVPWVQLQNSAQSALLAGLIVAASWLGILLVSPWTQAVVHRLGERPALWAACFLSTLSITGLALTDPGLGWIPWMLLEGVSAGVRWVLAEAMVADRAPSGSKGRLVGWFEAVVGMTFFGGPALLAILGPARPDIPWVALALAAAGLALSLSVPASKARAEADADSPPLSTGASGLWACTCAYPLLPAIGFVGGFFEAGVSSLLPLLGTTLGMGSVQASWLMAASGIASALAMVPIGKLADRQVLVSGAVGQQGHTIRLKLMRHCALACLLSALLMPFTGAWPWLAFAMAMVWGSAGGSLYTLAMIDLGEAASHRLIQKTCVLVMAYTLGGMVGPLVSGATLAWAPQHGLGLTLAALSAALWCGLWREARRRVPQGSRSVGATSPDL